MPPAPKCLKRGMFLPDGPSYQDVQLKPQWMTLAYAQTLQYRVEEANPPGPSEPHPLAMNIKELRRHRGKYTTFNEHDVFEGLGNALPEDKDKDMGTPPADSTTSSAMTDVEDTQPSLMGTPTADATTPSAMTDIKDTPPSPTETQLMNDPIPPLSMYKPEGKDRGTPLAKDTIVPLAEPEARIEKDLSAAWGASPARLEDLVAPTTTLVDKSASPPTLANSTVSKGQEYLEWVKVHSSQKVATVGSVSYKPRGPWQHCNCSSKQCKKA